MTEEYYLFTKQDIYFLKKGIEIHKKINDAVKKLLVPGSSPFEVNLFVKSECKKYKVRSSFFGQKNAKGQPFPAHCCVLVNEEIVHNVPVSKVAFKNGDVVKFDFGIIYNGFYTDFGFSVIIGDDVYNKKLLVDVAKMSVDRAKLFAIDSKKTGDISSQLQNIPLMYGFKPVHFFCGHGIGKMLHMSPQIPFWGNQNEGEILKDGMVLCIENWIAEKSNELDYMDDGWTCVLKDKSYSSFYETMVLVKKDSFEDLCV
ncbi:MAG: type I methionyl aminopeptidase [Candidatus Dojkabacteria bacterium]|nr:type I methionyl aminopeptidase [Candidatus Dojkabacteria bacterium]